MDSNMHHRNWSWNFLHEVCLSSCDKITRAIVFWLGIYYLGFQATFTPPKMTWYGHILKKLLKICWCCFAKGLWWTINGTMLLWWVVRATWNFKLLSLLTWSDHTWIWAGCVPLHAVGLCLAGTSDYPMEDVQHEPLWARSMFQSRPWNDDASAPFLENSLRQHPTRERLQTGHVPCL